MADAADRADELTSEQLAASLGRIHRYQGESATDCHDCGEPIPEARRVALPGITLCIYCQTLAEGRRP